MNRIVLEIIAETEVSEHFKERVMTRRVADVIKVVVLAAGADALLRGRCAVQRLIKAQEVGLELVHTGIGKEQRRIVLGNDRA